MESPDARTKFQEHLKKHDGARYIIEPYIPESRKMRGFFEGAVLPLITFYQDKLDHRDWTHVRRVREWVLTEFNGEITEIGGKPNKTAKSSKGILPQIMERVLDWMGEQGYQIELLKPEDYKDWRDRIYPYGGPDNYIDYLVSKSLLRAPVDKSS